MGAPASSAIDAEALAEATAGVVTGDVDAPHSWNYTRDVARTIVSDSGPGIAPDILPRIFEPFAQFPDDAAHVGSAGLGLYIAKEIVEAHNGRIFARSELGHGTTFTVDIPVREEAIG